MKFRILEKDKSFYPQYSKLWPFWCNFQGEHDRFLYRTFRTHREAYEHIEKETNYAIEKERKGAEERANKPKVHQIKMELHGPAEKWIR